MELELFFSSAQIYLIAHTNIKAECPVSAKVNISKEA